MMVPYLSELKGSNKPPSSFTSILRVLGDEAKLTSAFVFQNEPNQMMVEVLERMLVAYWHII